MYQIYYPNSGTIQYKILISHTDWLKCRELPENLEKQALKNLSNGNEWFTDKSPLYGAINSGILHCNGKYPCIVTKIE